MLRTAHDLAGKQKVGPKRSTQVSKKSNRPLTITGNRNRFNFNMKFYANILRRQLFCTARVCCIFALLQGYDLLYFSLYKIKTEPLWISFNSFLFLTCFVHPITNSIDYSMRTPWRENRLARIACQVQGANEKSRSISFPGDIAVKVKCSCGIDKSCSNDGVLTFAPCRRCLIPLERQSYRHLVSWLVSMAY